ncbi:methyl-accepting chemotaxis protein, partial [Aureimonas populi]
VTQQNAAMVEQATAAAQALSGETDELAQMAGRFHTGASGGGEQPGRAAARPAPRPAGTRVVQMRTAGRGGAAPAVAANEDGWEEF